MLRVLTVSNWPFLRIDALKCIAQSQHRICGMIILAYSGKKRTKKIVTKILARIPGGLRVSGHLSGRISPEKVELFRAARQENVKVFEVADINAPAVSSHLRKSRPDVILTLTWPEKFGPELLELPALGCINCHRSLLPLYRGPNPIPNAILSGDTKTGVTFHLMNEEFDMGDIMLQKEVSIDSADNSGTLSRKCEKVVIDSLLELLDNLENGKLHPVPQDPKAGSYAPRLNKSDLIVDWGKTAEEIENRIRAFLPSFQSYTYHKMQRITITKFEKREIKPVAPPGQIMAISDEGILVATQDAGLFLHSFVLQGLTEHAAQQYLSNEVRKGDMLSIA